MKLNDVVAVIGLKNRATDVVEVLCRSFGIRVFYAMKKTDPSQRIDSCDDEALVSSPFEDLPENVFRLGLMAANPLFEDGTLDCNLTEEREMLQHVLAWIAHRIDAAADSPGKAMLMNDEKAGLGPAPELEPCPFCGNALSVKWRKRNPSARCTTDGCWGAKMPALQLDIPEYIAAWNTRPSISRM